MKASFSVGLFFFTVLVFSQYNVSKTDSLAVVEILFKQQDDWNKGDIDAFMQGYLNSDKLVFSGASGPVFGWEATRARYKKNYSDHQKMGVLKFDILNMIALSPSVIQLQGRFYLTRTLGDAQGYFTLNWIKKKGRWFIISDHTSASNP
jgi:hypothetical protein